MDSEGKLSPEETTRIAEFIKAKGATGSPCASCGENAWSIATHVVKSQVYTPGLTKAIGAYYPQVLLVCKNCHFVRAFMAVPMGIVLSDAEEAELKAKENAATAAAKSEESADG